MAFVASFEAHRIRVLASFICIRSNFRNIVASSNVAFEGQGMDLMHRVSALTATELAVSSSSMAPSSPPVLRKRKGKSDLSGCFVWAPRKEGEGDTGGKGKENKKGNNNGKGKGGDKGKRMDKKDAHGFEDPWPECLDFEKDQDIAAWVAAAAQRICRCRSPCH